MLARLTAHLGLAIQQSNPVEALEPSVALNVLRTTLHKYTLSELRRCNKTRLTFKLPNRFVKSAVNSFFTRSLAYGSKWFGN
jgi:hypothetical protein